MNGAERLSQDPTFRLVGSEKIWNRGAALTSRLQTFETEMLAEEDWELVADELAAAAGEDGRSAGETCALLLAFAARRTSEWEGVRQHAEKDRGVAAAGRLANQDRKQTSARKPSIGEVSAARQTGAGKTSTAAPQNGQNGPHYHPKGPARLAVDTAGHEG